MMFEPCKTIIIHRKVPPPKYLETSYPRFKLKTSILSGNLHTFSNYANF